MVPNKTVCHAYQRSPQQAPLRRNSTQISQQLKKTCKEITKDLLERQSEYERLNKTYIPKKFSPQDHFLEKKKKYNVLNLAVRQARQKFLEKQSSSCSNHNQQFFQQQQCITIIAQNFRNQKSTLSLRSKNQKQERNKLSLYLLLMIALPAICLLVLISEYINLN
ncbi:unnamed protein product [Paramecium octaurelia]|uniref:Transmembrane protein n=1 Tax=Paramecium octaurelia TaxID=43137 RepID=A0A8S1W707_PAROT|nr:unnamed protein product [Paramecium octaurelia]